MPKVSCIMPVYNTAKYLDECIESILNQTFTDFEFIISDDGSTDGSKEIIKKYVEKDNRIIFLDNPVNRGVVDNLNDCLDKSSGEYIAIMESDDISMPERFEIQVKFLDENKTLDIVGTSIHIINEESVITGTGIYENNSNKVRKNFLKIFPFSSPSIMFKAEIINKLGKFKNGIIWDYDFFINLFLEGYKGTNLTEILFKKRELNKGMLNSNYLKVINNQLITGITTIKKHNISYSLYLDVFYKYISNFFYYAIIIVTKKIKIHDYLSHFWRKYIIKNK